MIYKALFDIFIMSAGPEHGDVYQLPYAGGVLDQPGKTMKVWLLFTNELRSHIAKENKKASNKMKSRR